MLSYKEYKKLKQNNNPKFFEDIDNFFDNFTSEIVGFVISPKRSEKLINFCESCVNSDLKRWKTIQEHRMIKQLPLIIRETLEGECIDVRSIISESRYKIKTLLKEFDSKIDAWATLHNRNQQAATSIEKEIETIFQQLKVDLLNQYGVNRGVQTTPSTVSSTPATTSMKKPGLWNRAKNWLKGVWHGMTGGDPNLRKFALSKGYADSPYYRTDPHAWKDTEKHPEFFPQTQESKITELSDLFIEDFKEAKAIFDNIFLKHKRDLMNLVARYVLQSLDVSLNKGTNYPEPEPTPTEPETPTSDKGSEEPDPIQKQKIVEPEKTEYVSLNSQDFNLSDLVEAIKTRKPDGILTLKDKKGNIYSFSVDQQGESNTHITFKNNEANIRITKRKWSNAEKLSETPGKQIEELPPEEPEVKKTPEKPIDTDDDGSPSAETEEEMKKSSQTDEDDYDDTETGKPEDFAKQSGMSVKDLSQEEEEEDDEAAKWLKQFGKGEEPEESKPEEPSEPEPEESKPVEPEEPKPEPEKIDLSKHTSKPMSQSNLKNIRKSKDGGLELKYRNNWNKLDVQFDEKSGMVYLSHPLAAKGKYNVKYITRDQYDKLLEKLGVSSEMPQPEKSEGETKSKERVKPRKEIRPKEYSGEDIISHGRSALDKL